MTELDKLVHDRPKEEIIHIGSHDGFFFVGTAAEYEERIDEISTALKERMVRNAQKNLAYFENKFAATMAKATEGETPTPKALKNLAEAMSSALKNKAMSVRFKPVREREIDSSYEGIYKDTWKIIVKGDESGKYWDREEYLQDNAQENNNKC